MINNDDILTLCEASKLLRISMGYAYQSYHLWKDYGVRILKPRPNAHPRFYRKDILKMMEVCK